MTRANGSSGTSPSTSRTDPEEIDSGAAGGWRPLADQVAGHVRDFLDALSTLGRGEGEGELVPLLLLEVAQVMLAGAKLGASRDVIPSGNVEPYIGADPDLDALRTRLAGAG